MANPKIESFADVAHPLNFSLVDETKLSNPCLNFEFGSENTLNPSDTVPTKPPIPAPIAVPTPGSIAVPIAAPIPAPLSPAPAIPAPSSAALHFSIPKAPLNIEPFSAPPVSTPKVVALALLIPTSTPAAFCCSAVIPA